MSSVSLFFESRSVGQQVSELQRGLSQVVLMTLFNLHVLAG